MKFWNSFDIQVLDRIFQADASVGTVKPRK